MAYPDGRTLHSFKIDHGLWERAMAKAHGQGRSMTDVIARAVLAFAGDRRPDIITGCAIAGGAGAEPMVTYGDGGTVVSAGAGGSLEVLPGGEVWLGPGTVIEAREGGGFAIVSRSPAQSG